VNSLYKYFFKVKHILLLGSSGLSGPWPIKALPQSDRDEEIATPGVKEWIVSNKYKVEGDLIIVA
jgi:hypothetical protein